MKPAPFVSRFFPPISTGCRHAASAVVIALVVLPLVAKAQTTTDQDKHLDIRSSVGDLHVGKDADARRVGLPLYPGAQLKSDDGNSDRVNMGIATEAFGMKLVVAKYESSDPPARILDFYRDKLKMYGKVLECHTSKHGGDVNVEADEKEHSRQLKCDDNEGSVTELKVGTEDNQHIVAVEPADAGKGSTFCLVYLHTRGKQGDI